MAGKGAFRGTFVIGRSAIKRPQIRRVGNIIGLFTRLTQRFRLQFPMGIVMLSFARTPFSGISCQKTMPTHPIRGHFLPTRYDAPPVRNERRFSPDPLREIPAREWHRDERRISRVSGRYDTGEMSPRLVLSTPKLERPSRITPALSVCSVHRSVRKLRKWSLECSAAASDRW